MNYKNVTFYPVCSIARCRTFFLVGLISGFIYLFSPLYAQRVLLEEDVNADTVPATQGPNRKKFKHFFIGASFAAGADKPGSKIDYFLSKELNLGLRYKRRLNNTVSVGFELLYRNILYSIKQSPGKLIPNTTFHDRERLAYNCFAGAIYNRINFGKRGNYIGKFLDLGGRFNWAFATTHFTKDLLETPNASQGEVVKIRTSHLLFTKPFFYDAMARIGFNRYVFTFSYRLNPLFKPVNENTTFVFPDLPRLMAGFEVGLHK